MDYSSYSSINPYVVAILDVNYELYQRRPMIIKLLLKNYIFSNECNVGSRHNPIMIEN